MDKNAAHEGVIAAGASRATVRVIRTDKLLSSDLLLQMTLRPPLTFWIAQWWTGRSVTTERERFLAVKQVVAQTEPDLEAAVRAGSAKQETLCKSSSHSPRGTTTRCCSISTGC